MSKAKAEHGGQAALGNILNNHGVAGLVGQLSGGTIVIQHLHITTAPVPVLHQPAEISGLIAHFSLQDWWLSLSEVDRGIIDDAIGPEVCREKIHATSRSACSWLRGIAWRICVVHPQLASRLRAKATGIETGTEIDDYWSRQMDVIRRHWKQLDYGAAREEVRAVGYRMREENALPDERQRFESLQAEFVRADPWYTEVMSAVIPIVESRPGVVQSTLTKCLPFDADRVRYALWHAEALGDIKRVKHGRSYGLFLAKEEK